MNVLNAWDSWCLYPSSFLAQLKMLFLTVPQILIPTGHVEVMHPITSVLTISRRIILLAAFKFIRASKLLNRREVACLCCAYFPRPLT